MNNNPKKYDKDPKDSFGAVLASMNPKVHLLPKPPTVVNIKFDECDLYIGRGSKWGNPFPVWECESREDCLQKYEWYLYHQRSDLLADLRELEGKVLGCYCKPRECHGDILVELFKERYGNRKS